MDTVGKPVLGYGAGGRVADDRLGEATYRTGNDRKAMNHASGIGEASRVDGKKLHKLAAARAEELPGAELTHPFGPDWEVYKVRDRVFMLLTAVTGDPIVVLKATPSDGQALREEYDDVTPGYHMNKKHWITLSPGGSIDRALVEDVVTESYLLVVEKLPKAKQPVDPSDFGKRDQ